MMLQRVSKQRKALGLYGVEHGSIVYVSFSA